MDNTQLQKSVESVISAMELITIENQEQLTEANEFVKKCKVTAKEVEAFFSDDLSAAQEKKKAAEAERKAVSEKIKFFTDKLDKAERAIKNKMSAYLTEQERIRREEEAKKRAEEEARRIETAIETGHEEILDRPVAIVKEPEPELAQGTYTVDVWEYEIIDKTKINAEFLIPDEKGIGATVRSMKERAQSIVGPGVKVTCRKDIRTRT